MGSEPIGKLIGEPETGNMEFLEPGSKVAEDIQTALEMAEAVQQRMLMRIHTS